MLGHTDGVIVTEVPCGLEATVPTEGPAVITAHQIRCRRLSRPGDDAGAMGAHVVESAQLARWAHSDENRPAGHVGDDAVAGGPQLG